MKITKRVLAVALALALGLALLMPALAADPNAPVITKQWRIYSNVYVGETIAFEIEAKLPSGVDGELSYAWKLGPWGSNTYYAEGTGPRFEITFTEDMLSEIGFLSSYGHLSLSVVITNTFEDSNGDEKTASITQSMSMQVNTVSWWELILALPLNIILLPMGILGLGFVGPLILPFLPLVIPSYIDDMIRALKVLLS